MTPAWCRDSIGKVAQCNPMDENQQPLGRSLARLTVLLSYGVPPFATQERRYGA